MTDPAAPAAPPPDRTHHRQALFALGWSSIGTIVMFTANALAVVVLSRLVDPAAFGVIAAATSIGLILKVVGPFAVTQATLQAGDRPGILQAGTNVAWLVTVILAATLFICAGPLSAALGLGDDSWVLRAWAPILLAQGAAVPAQVVLQRNLRFKEISLVQGVAALLGTAIIPIVLALIGWGLGALYVALLAQAVIELIGLFLVLGTVIVPNHRSPHTRALVGRTWSFSTLFAAGLVSTQGDNLVVAATLGSDALGFYSRAYKLMALPAYMIGDIIDTVLYPVILRSRDDLDAVAGGLRLATTLSSVVLLPVSAVAVVLGDLIIKVLLGPQWTAAVATFQILAAGMYFRVAVKPFEVAMRGLGRQRTLTVAVAACAVGVVVAALIGGQWSIEIVAAGVVSVLSLYFVLVVVLAARIIGRASLPMLATATVGLPAALICAAVALLVSNLLDGMSNFPRLVVAVVAGLAPALVSFLFPGTRRSLRTLTEVRRGAPGQAPAEHAG